MTAIKFYTSSLETFFPSCLEKLKNGKKPDFLPQKCPKNRKYFDINHFQATDLHDCSNRPQYDSKQHSIDTLFSWLPRKIEKWQKM